MWVTKYISKLDVRSDLWDETYTRNCQCGQVPMNKQSCAWVEDLILLFYKKYIILNGL